jgi:hypothetical protein
MIWILIAVSISDYSYKINCSPLYSKIRSDKSSGFSFSEVEKGHFPFKIDLTNVKMPSLVEEPFERKWLAFA